MGALRPPLSGRRCAIVKAAWESIDEKNEGCVSIERLQECYDVSRNGDFIEGNMTKEQIFQSFVDGLSYNGQPVTQVRCCHEWKFYQQDMSLAIVDDEYFVRMTEAVWNIQEDCTATVSKQEVEHVVRTIRKRCLDLSSVNQSADAVLRSLYREIDGPQPSGILTVDMFSQIMKKLQVVIADRYLESILRAFDRNKDGRIEFEELVSHLMEKPYR